MIEALAYSRVGAGGLGFELVRVFFGWNGTMEASYNPDRRPAKPRSRWDRGTFGSGGSRGKR